MAFTLNDLWYFWLSGQTGTPSGGEIPTPVTTTEQIANKYPSRSNVGTQTAPPASTIIATHTVTESGYYRIRCLYGYGGTSESATEDNFVLDFGTAPDITLLAVAGTNNELFPIQEFYRELDASEVVSINSGSVAGSAGSIYKAQLTLDRLN